MAENSKPAPSKHSAKQVRLIMWTTPRSTSTAVVKCFSLLKDSQVYFEPFAAAYHVGPERVSFEIRDPDTPGIFADFAKELSEAIEDDKDVSKYSYDWVKKQLETPHIDKAFVFCKDMAYTVAQHLGSIPNGYRHMFLIRHPLKVFSSWKKVLQVAVRAQPDVFQLDRLPSWLFPDGYGCKELIELLDHVRATHDKEATVVDSDDLLQDPEGIMRALFGVLKMPFEKTNLTWDAESDVSNAWVAPKLLLDGNKRIGYYQAALESTSFRKPGGLPDRSSLSPDILRCVDASMPYYDKMYAQRLKPTQSYN